MVLLMETYITLTIIKIDSWVWWCISVVPVLGRLRQEDHKFKASLGYKLR
jgi:hypothetical protein